ncbi:MAG TPA: hypothetical protein VMU86_02425 [Steroidobacteraceae bacterium]|nr:hypothetical protein [Steroidobacteraceae bacterium]
MNGRCATLEPPAPSPALPDGIRLAYLQMGDPNGEPVVLIHGYTDSARDWVPMRSTCRSAFA